MTKKYTATKLKMAIRLSCWLLSFLVSGYLLFSACVLLFFPNSAVNVLGYRFYVISYTGSMEPELSYRDLIVVHKYDFDKLKKGDYITFNGKLANSDKSVPITHEIIDIVTDKDGKVLLKTKGKNVPSFDTIPVTKDGANGTNRYIGKFAYKSTFLGHVVTFLQSGAGLATMIVNLLALVGIFVVLNDRKRHKAQLAKEAEATAEHAVIAEIIDTDPELQKTILQAIEDEHDGIVLTNVTPSEPAHEQEPDATIACPKTMQAHGEGEVISTITLTDHTETPIATLEVIKVEPPQED